MSGGGLDLLMGPLNSKDEFPEGTTGHGATS